MAFVSEKISTEDINYFNSFGFKDILGKPAKAYWWAIDRKQSVFLFPRGGGTFEISTSFGLCVDKELIEIEVLKITNGSRYDNNLRIQWTIKKIAVPKKIIETGHTNEEIKKFP